MSLEEFHAELRADIRQMSADHQLQDETSFPSEELLFSEWSMDHLESAGICGDPVVCHWNGKVSNATLRVSGYSLSADGSSLDLFVTHFFGTVTITDLSDPDAGRSGAAGVRFLIEAARGTLDKRVAPTHPIRELVSLIMDQWASLDRIRVFVLTDGRTKTKSFKPKEVKGKLVSIEAMDVERLYRHLEGSPRDEIVLDLKIMCGRSLPCVHVPDADADYEHVLVALPAIALKELYAQYGPRLLEANVRTFLGTKNKNNREIANTLRREPEHFLAFNNGLVMVCDKAEFDRTAEGIGLSLLRGIQIVNGGQTTSSIYFTSREDRNIDLAHVMVPVKIIVLKNEDDEARETLISKVSRYANSQTAIKLSDLSSNRPFHVQLETLSRRVWCPDGATRWFYERAAGAYNVMLLGEGATSAKRRNLRMMIPPKRRITKNALAKYHEAWRGLPQQVALAGEKNFQKFMEAMDDEPGIVPNPLTEEWYRAMIAKIILFQSIESLIKNKNVRDVFRQGWVNISAYVLALVGEQLGDIVNLEMIWRNQRISGELGSYLMQLAKLVNEKFEEIAPGQQFSEVAKRGTTWSKVRAMEIPPRKDSIPELYST